LAFKIVYKRSVERDLKKLAKPAASRILDQVEEELAKKAATYPVLKGPFAGLRKCRIGDYRIIFAVLGEEVFILRIAHRGEVDKKAIQ